MSEKRSAKVLSCASCRQRKIKCDKVQPLCTPCVRVGIECVFPSRKPTRRAPRTRQSELLERISRLESIVGKADPSMLEELDRLSQPQGSGAQPLNGQDDTIMASRDGPSAQSEIAQPTTADTAARYLSSEFWNNLCDEVVGIKQALEEPSDPEDVEDEVEEESNESYEGPLAGVLLDTPSGYMFGNPSYHDKEKPSHPPRDMILRLWAIYLRNVDPLMKILHQPTLSNELQLFANSSSRSLSASQHARLFSIYFAAVTTLSEEDCLRQLGRSKQELASNYRLNTEKALAAADYLSQPTLISLQALTIYVTMLRCYPLSRASWVLTSTVIRIAQAMNLHRDGDGHRFSTFEAEMRRRLWHFITVIDIRAAEDRGSDAILTSSSHNTALPTNIDDDDFGPSSQGPLVPKATPADNIICMCTARCGVFGYITHPHTKTSEDGQDTLHTEDELIGYVRALENDFIHTADPSHLNSRYASEVARMVILKLWLIVQYPFSAHPTVTPMRVSQETMLRTAVSVMELSERMTQGPWASRFAWWTDCYVQWHPLAVALAELCVQRDGELVNRAWKIVDQVYPRWKENVADSSSGPLWRPIRKLYRKAKAAKTGAMMGNLSLDQACEKSLAGGLSAPTIDLLSGGTAIGQPQAGLDPALEFPITFDDATDPSFLFQFPTTSPAGLDHTTGMPLDMGVWADFLNDTQMDFSPEGSGTGESS